MQVNSLSQVECLPTKTKQKRASVIPAVDQRIADYVDSQVRKMHQTSGKSEFSVEPPSEKGNNNCHVILYLSVIAYNSNNIECPVAHMSLSAYLFLHITGFRL